MSDMDRATAIGYIDSIKEFIHEMRPNNANAQDALDIALQDMKKQVPMDTYFTTMDEGFFEVCPVCKDSCTSKYQHYCSSCGQAILWESEVDQQ